MKAVLATHHKHHMCATQVDTIAPYQADQEGVSNTIMFTSQQTTAVTDSYGCGSLCCWHCELAAGERLPIMTVRACVSNRIDIMFKVSRFDVGNIMNFDMLSSLASPLNKLPQQGVLQVRLASPTCQMGGGADDHLGQLQWMPAARTVDFEKARGAAVSC